MSLKDRIISLRNEKNISLSELSRLSGVAKSTLFSLEKGDSKQPQAKTLQKIANAFNISVDSLLSEDANVESDLTSREIELIKKYDGTEDFKDVERALKFLLEQPMMLNYGGYDLRKMSDEDILEIANEMLFTVHLSIEKRRKRYNKIRNKSKN